MQIDGQKLKDHIWGQCSTLSIQMQHSKSKVLRAKYDAYEEIWNGIKDGAFALEESEAHT